MAGIAYGLGRFGDRRLEKGGPGCMRRWWRGPVRVFVAWAATGPGKCSFADFFTIRR
jgi:hypothetical protein